MNAEFNNLIVTKAMKRKLYYAFYELLNRVSLRFVSRTVVLNVCTISSNALYLEFNNKIPRRHNNDDTTSLSRSNIII